MAPSWIILKLRHWGGGCMRCNRRCIDPERSQIRRLWARSSPQARQVPSGGLANGSVAWWREWPVGPPTLSTQHVGRIGHGAPKKNPDFFLHGKRIGHGGNLFCNSASQLWYGRLCCMGYDIFFLREISILCWVGSQIFRDNLCRPNGQGTMLVELCGKEFGGWTVRQR